MANRGYKVNVANPVWAPMLSDTSEGTQYGPVVSLGEAMEVNLVPVIAKGQLYGDGIQQSAKAKVTGYTATLDTTKVPVASRMAMFNINAQDGVFVEAGGAQANYGAFGYKVEQDNGEDQYVWLLKCMPNPISDDAKQSDTGINYSTDKLELDCIPRKSDSNVRYFSEVGEEGFTAEQGALWFSAGPAAPVAKPEAPSGDGEESQ